MKLLPLFHSLPFFSENLNNSKNFFKYIIVKINL